MKVKKMTATAMAAVSAMSEGLRVSAALTASATVAGAKEKGTAPGNMKFAIAVTQIATSSVAPL